MSNANLSLQEIWRQGCQGLPLEAAEFEHFEHLARSRFHTFDLSAAQAGDTRAHQEAQDWIALLVKGLVKELSENPGLERLWYRSAYADSPHGRSVSFGLTKLLS